MIFFPSVCHQVALWVLSLSRFFDSSFNFPHKRMKTTLTVFFIFITVSLISSQKPVSHSKIDSLTHMVMKTDMFNDEGLYKAKELYYRAKEAHYKNGQIRLLLRIVDLQVGSVDLVGALEHIKILKPLALSVDDYESYISACGLEAKIFFLDKNFSQAKSILHAAENYLPQIDDPEKRRKAKIEINIYKWYTIENAKFPQDSYMDSLVTISKGIYNESVQIFNPDQRAKRILLSANLLTTSLTQLKRYKEAYHFVNIAEKQVRFLGDQSFLGVDFYAAKGDLEYSYKPDGKPAADSALASYNKAIAIGERLNYSAQTKKLYAKVAKIYQAKKDFEKQMVFMDKYMNLKDSLEIKKGIALGDLKSKVYEVKDYPNEGRAFSGGSKNFYTAVGMAFLIFASVLGFKKIGTLKKKSVGEKLSTEKNIPDTSSKSIAHLIALAEKSDKSFYHSFLETFPDFAEKLLAINATMKSTDIEFCAYIKLNFETKKIAVLKNMSVRAVEGKKYRIRKKLNISADENMYLRLSKL